MSYQMDYEEFEKFKGMSKSEIKEQLLQDFSTGTKIYILNMLVMMYSYVRFTNCL